MKRALALLIPVLALAAAAAPAGDEEHKKRCAADAEACIRDMAAGLKQRGWIGIEWEEVEGRPQISHVVAGSPAERAGIRIGDVVLRFNGLSTAEDDEAVWAEMKRSLVPGKVVTLSIQRAGPPLEIPVELVAVPDHIIAQWVGQHVITHHAAAAEAAAEPSP